MEEKLRKLLNVPKEQRIAQYIYNQFRDYEDSYTMWSKFGKQNSQQVDGRGIDIFYVSDAEFIKRFSALSSKEK